MPLFLHGTYICTVSTNVSKDIVHVWRAKINLGEILTSCKFNDSGISSREDFSPASFLSCVAAKRIICHKDMPVRDQCLFTGPNYLMWAAATNYYHHGHVAEVQHTLTPLATVASFFLFSSWKAMCKFIIFWIPVRIQVQPQQILGKTMALASDCLPSELYVWPGLVCKPGPWFCSWVSSYGSSSQKSCMWVESTYSYQSRWRKTYVTNRFYTILILKLYCCKSCPRRLH